MYHKRLKSIRKTPFILLYLFAITSVKAQTLSYNFTGNGDWNNAANWNNNIIPPAILPANTQISIDPLTGGKCILSTAETVLRGASFIVQQNANFIINGNLLIEPGNTILPNTIDKTDTLKVMTYNVLNYGDGCQGSLSTLNGYFKTIIKYTQPDLLSCVKMEAFNPAVTGVANTAAVINDSVLNIVFPGTYVFITPTNNAGDDKMSCLFYNKQKLTYIKTETLVVDVSDFNLYKLYYNDPNLYITHDTTFLYVIVNHTQSGSSTTRDQQVTQEMQTIRAKFAYLPNLINMGDFNTANSSEKGYQTIISTTDSATAMSDPSFYPDSINQYPADWTNRPDLYPFYLTTSTRQSSTQPNSCGTDGGAKSWFDHIFISPWLVSGADYITYLPHSYQTIGNDGKRNGVSVNSVTPIINTSAPADVINALFQLSNKYPVVLKLLVKTNRSGGSPVNPAERN